ncbi:hypothetical protein LWI29_021352 [Acer saccharum]|uniref:Uncharacterized protein n=1 Tax=Acer saccharum TaxID=4024 RepID=A0AA39T3R3_ACESA|nr:hypothetical protein LWI29_021352 [Acer saccharum]
MVQNLGNQSEFVEKRVRKPVITALVTSAAANRVGGYPGRIQARVGYPGRTERLGRTSGRTSGRISGRISGRTSGRILQFGRGRRLARGGDAPVGRLRVGGAWSHSPTSGGACGLSVAPIWLKFSPVHSFRRVEHSGVLKILF